MHTKMLTSLWPTLTGSHAGSSGITSTPTGKVGHEISHEPGAPMEIFSMLRRFHNTIGGTTMSEPESTDQNPESKAVTVADQITALIIDVDERIAAKRVYIKAVTEHNQEEMKALLAERKAITAAIQGVRRRSPGKPAKARKAKVKKVEVAA